MASQISIEARTLISAGEFEGALDLLWDSIDKGSESSRLALANLFDECGLHAFSQDQYEYLMSTDGPEYLHAALGLFQNLVWMRNYKAASALALKHEHIQKMHGDYATKSEQDFSTKRFPPEHFSNLISQLLFDRQENLAAIDSDETFNSLQNMMVIDENLFNIACDLKFGDSAMLASVSVEVQLGGGPSVSRMALDAVGEPLIRARNYLQTCANLIRELSTLEGLEDDEPILEFARSKGNSIANKLVLLQEDFTLSDEDSMLVSNVCWALQKSTTPIDRFSGFVLGGITND